MKLVAASLPPTLSARPQSAPKEQEVPPEHRLQLDQVVRYGRDIGSVLTDIKTVGVCVANVVKLPANIQRYLGACNGGSLIGGVVGLAVDIFGAKKVFDNPASTHKDKVVDLVHIALSDVLGTACGAIPLFASLSNPVFLTLFIAGQAIGVASDIYKIVHDIKDKPRGCPHESAPPTLQVS